MTNRFRRGASPVAMVLALLSLGVWAAVSSSNVAPQVSLTSPTNGAIYAPGTAITMSATASDANNNLSVVEFYVGSNMMYRDSSAPYSYTWKPTVAGNYTLKAIAKDTSKASTTSALVSVSIQATTPPPTDTQAPTVPTGLSVGSPTTSTLTLNWVAATDNVAVSAYDVYRNSALVGSVSGTTFTDSALAPASSYSYTVRARDAAGNTSTQSAAVVGTTNDATTQPPSTVPKRVVGYFTQWGIYNGYMPKQLDASGTAAKLTHLTYAFGNVRNNRCEVGILKSNDATTGEGGDAYADYSRTYTAAESVDGVGDVWGAPLRGNWNQLKKLKQKYPNLKVVMSLGGWNWSRGFAEAARPENRQAFVASCIDAYIKGNLPAFDAAGGAGAAAGVFDGIDIDWEFPAACGVTCGTSEDTANFTGLLAEFRKQLDAVRPGLVLSAAIGAGVDKIRVTQPEIYQNSVDYINLMSYDFHGGWDAKTNFHSALFNSPNDPSQGDARYYNTNDAVQALLSRGVAPAKINLGMASYGRGWKNVASTNNGLYQSGVAADGSVEPGIESYRKLITLGYPSFVDPLSYGQWIYGNGVFWSFDNPASVAKKMDYVKTQSLGGAFLWDFSGDTTNGDLATAMYNGLQ